MQQVSIGLAHTHTHIHEDHLFVCRENRHVGNSCIWSWSDIAIVGSGCRSKLVRTDRVVAVAVDVALSCVVFAAVCVCPCVPTHSFRVSVCVCSGA